MGMIQIRNVPDDLHRRLKARAAAKGVSLSDLMLQLAERFDETPPIEELLARLKTRNAAALSMTPAEAVRAERDAR